jgi:hypothetical protein
MKEAGVALPATASAWAYFLVHSLHFLATRGRLAMLVPEAILQADYAVVVRDLLASRFHDVCMVYIRDRLFQGTEEAVVTVAAAEYGKAGRLRVEAIDRADDLASVLEPPSQGRRRTHLITKKGRILDSSVMELLDELQQTTDVHQVSELATVTIGIVTGANRYFIRNVERLKEFGIPREAWIQIVARTRWLSGVDFTDQDFEELVDKGERAFLVGPAMEYDDNPGIRRWIAEGVESRIYERYKCTIRDPWFRVALPPTPKAFVTCTRLGAPLLVLNRTNCRSTNAIHAIHWHGGCDAVGPAVVVGFLTSAVGVWTELHGRRYGGGVLKMEPGSLKRAPVPIAVSAKDILDEVNELIRSGREQDARGVADDRVLGAELGLARSDIRKLQRACERLKLQRTPVRR